MATQLCTKCGNPLRAGVKFCARCGQPAPPPAPVARPADLRCPRCGKPVRANARFCASCGYILAPSTEADPEPHPPPALNPPNRRNLIYLLRHALTAGLLFVCLLLSLAGVYAYDTGHPRAAPTPLALNLTPGALPPISFTPEVELNINNSGRFGLITTSGGFLQTGKRLTFSPAGGTNNTRVQVDGRDAIFGENFGSFVITPQKRGNGMLAAWSYQGIETREEVTITVGATTRRTDTMRVQYTLSNHSQLSHMVALRIMLDTLIGDNDGVPYLLSGESAITTNAKDLRGSAVPDFLQALERPDVANPGTIVNIAMRGNDATPPDRLVIAHWPGSNAEWEYLPREGGVGAGWDQDSSIGLYYNALPLAPGESRTMVFYYGLGGLAASGNLGLTVPLEVTEKEKFSILLIVMNPHSGQRVRLTLPPALGLVQGEQDTKEVLAAPGSAFTQVSWNLRALAPSDAAQLSVRLEPEVETATQTIRVAACGLTRPCSSAP